MRIVGGKFRGARLLAPEGQALRPTSDRVREALFNILAHGVEDFELCGARVLDLFAGTGALGLEALSRGAAYCLFIDNSTSARSFIRRNIEALGLTGQTRLFRRDATQLGPAGTVAPFDLLLADPPYGKGLAERALSAAAKGGWLRPGAVCVVEERTDVAFMPPPEFTVQDRRVYGQSALHFLRFTSGDRQPEPA